MQTICEGTCTTICVWGSENNSVRSVVFFHLNVGCEDQTQVGGKHHVSGCIYIF